MFKNEAHYHLYVTKSLRKKGIVTNYDFKEFFKCDEHTARRISYHVLKEIDTQEQFDNFMSQPYENLKIMIPKPISGRVINEDKLFELHRKPGVYRLHNSNGKVMYVGKSVDLCSRLPASLYEKGLKHASYAITKSQSDAALYEIYYICYLKPEYNKESKYNDYLSVKLDHLLFSDIIQFVE